MRTMEFEKTLKNTYLSLRLRPDGIVEIRAKDDAPNESSLEIAQMNTKTVQDFCAGMSLPAIAYMTNRKIETEERRYYAAQRSQLSAVAIMVSNPLQRMMANFFLGLNKLQLPMMLFTDEGKAIAWLKQYRE